MPTLIFFVDFQDSENNRKWLFFPILALFSALKTIEKIIAGNMLRNIVRICQEDNIFKENKLALRIRGRWPNFDFQKISHLFFTIFLGGDQTTSNWPEFFLLSLFDICTQKKIWT